MVKRKLQEERNADWTNQERLQLLRVLQDQCPEGDKLSYSSRSKKVDWSSLALEGRQPEECQAEWSSLLSKVRKFRTLREVVTDAQDMVLHPEKYKSKNSKKNKHPDQPAKPLTAFFRFVQDHRQKLKAKHPEMNNLELQRLLSQKWTTLDEAKRSKYVERYRVEWRQFQEANAQFLQQHPELRKKQPEQPSPFGLFLKKKQKSYKEKYPEMSSLEIRNKLRKKYSKLSQEKKKKWIDKALAAVTDYEEEVRQYQANHPAFQPPAKKIRLTKVEEAIHERDGKVLNGPSKASRQKKFPGAPTPPPRSAFHLFMRKKFGGTEGSLQERTAAVCQQWQQLGEKQKKYTKKLNKLRAAYTEELEEFKQSLTEDQLREFEESMEQPKRKKKLKTEAA